MGGVLSCPFCCVVVQITCCIFSPSGRGVTLSTRLQPLLAFNQELLPKPGQQAGWVRVVALLLECQMCHVMCWMPRQLMWSLWLFWQVCFKSLIFSSAFKYIYCVLTMHNCPRCTPLILLSSKASDTPGDAFIIDMIIFMGSFALSYGLERSAIGHSSCLREKCQKAFADGFLIKYFGLTGFRHVLCAAALADFQSSWKMCLCLWVPVPIL